MSTEDQFTSTPSLTKSPIPRKNRILTSNQTIGNNGVSRLPSLLSKSSAFLANSETTYFKRRRPQQKDILNTSSSSSSKIERQTTNVNSQTRLPPLNHGVNDHNYKQTSDLQRRQIYALNHLMRELEQEQFRQFCISNGIGTENPEEVVSNDEDSTKQPATLV